MSVGTGRSIPVFSQLNQADHGFVISALDSVLYSDSDRYDIRAVVPGAGNFVAGLFCLAHYTIGYKALRTHQEYVYASDALFRCVAMARDAGLANVAGAGSYLKELGFFYYNIHNYERARALLEEALKYTFLRPEDELDCYNTLGLSWQHLDSMAPQSAFLFARGAKLAIRHGHGAWMGILIGNLSKMYLVRGDYARARAYLKVDMDLSEAYNEPVSAVDARIGIAECFLKEGKHLDSALLLLAQPEERLVHLGNYPELKSRYHSVRGRIFREKGRYGEAFFHLDSSEWYRSEAIRHRNAANVSNAILRTQSDIYNTRLQLVSSGREKEKLAKRLAAACIVILLLAGYIVYSRLLAKRRADLLRLQRMGDDLKYAQLQLNGYLENLREKNRIIEAFEEQISRHRAEGSPAQEDTAQTLRRLYNSIILTEDDWQQFKDLFMKVHGEFFYRFVNQFPESSQGELRVAAMTRLGFSIKDMARVLGISPTSVRQTRLRFWKKIGISDKQEWDKLIREC